MASANTEYVKNIVEWYVSGKWKYPREFKELPLSVLNSIIIEAEHVLKNDIQQYDKNDSNHLITFIKVNIPYSADEIFMEMYHSGEWFPHKSLTGMTTPELNTFLFDKLVEFQDKKVPYDNDLFIRLSLYLKAFTE